MRSIRKDIAFVDGSCSLQLLVSQLEVYVRAPRLFFGLPLHPALEHLSRRCHVAKQLLHVRVLVPELVCARHDGDCAVPQVARVVHLTVPENMTPCLFHSLSFSICLQVIPHLQFCVLQPQCDVAMINVQSSFVHRASSVEKSSGYLKVIRKWVSFWDVKRWKPLYFLLTFLPRSILDPVRHHRPVLSDAILKFLMVKHHFQIFNGYLVRIWKV